jgi:thiamine-monophosphate kinase
MALAPLLSEYATAAMDISDGLAGDLMKLAAASGVRGSIEAGRVPLSGAAQSVLAAEPALIETVLTGGDDYEIAATIPENRLGAFKDAARAVGIEVTTIGRIEAGEGVVVAGPDGQPIDLKQASFSHF